MTQGGVQPESDRSAQATRSSLASLAVTVDRSDPLGGRGARPVLYRIGPTSTSLLADHDIYLAAPIGDGTPQRRWVLDARDLGGTTRPPAGQLPFLFVEIAQDAEGVLVADLLAARVTTLTQGAEKVSAFADRALRDVRLGRLSPPARVIAVGEVDVPDGISTGVVNVRDLDRAREYLAETAFEFDLDHTATLIVVDADDTLEGFIKSVSAYRGIAVLAGCASPSARLVLLSSNASHAEAYLRARHEEVGRSTLSPPRQLELAFAQMPAATSGVTTRTPSPASGLLDVNVLGPIEIGGTTESTRHRPKLTELITYLAMHPEGALTRAWSTALWPERRVPTQTIANRLSEARQLIGLASDGRPRLRRNGERHQIVEASTDWHRFCALTIDDASQDMLIAALSIVRGRPFDDLQQGQWAMLEGFVSEIEERVSTTAIRLATEALSNTEFDLANWAANVGLRVDPFDERLHRLLMRSADGVGNRGALDSIVRHLATLLEIEGDPLLGVHPQTVALYRELTARKRPMMDVAQASR